MDVSKVILDKEFKPVEELLKPISEMKAHLDFLYGLKMCWDLVSQKSEEKDSEQFREYCVEILNNFLTQYRYGDLAGFQNLALLENLYAGPNGRKKLFPERCACHYATLRSLLRSAHYGEKELDEEAYKERAYYDFTLLFCPFMNEAAKDIFSGKYLETAKINPGTHRNYIMDFWEIKNDGWSRIKDVLYEKKWDEEQVEQLHTVFLGTILSPSDLIYKPNSKKVCYGIDTVSKFLLGTFMKRISAQRYRFRWSQLYSGAYSKPDRVESFTKNGRKPEEFPQDRNPIYTFMFSIFNRTIDQMNTGKFSIFSLSASPWIDWYKYCPVERGSSNHSYTLAVNGERLHKFTLYPSGQTTMSQQVDEESIVQTFHIVYAPVNAIWKRDRVQDAVSFYQFITDWVMDYHKGSGKQEDISFEDFLKDFEFSVEPYSEKLREEKQLLIQLKASFKDDIPFIKDDIQKIYMQNLLDNALNPWTENKISKLLRLIGEDQEVVSSAVCFQEDKMVKLQTDADVPKHLDLKANYMVEFTRDEFIAFLMYLAHRKKDVRLWSRYKYMKQDMDKLKWVCDCRGSCEGTKEQKITFAFVESEKIIAAFPIIIKRRSKLDDWSLTENDKEKVKQTVVEFFWNRWNTIGNTEEIPKKFDFIYRLIEHNIEESETILRHPYGGIYDNENCDPEISLLKRLVFYNG